MFLTERSAEIREHRSRSWTASSLLAVLALLLAIGATGTTAAAKASGAAEFCGPNFPLNPLNQIYDYCTDTTYHYNRVVQGYGAKHSVCVSSTTNGTKSGVNVSWACSPGPGYNVTTEVNRYAVTAAIIRNNTTGDGNIVRGTVWWCDGPGPGC